MVQWVDVIKMWYTHTHIYIYAYFRPFKLDMIILPTYSLSILCLSSEYIIFKMYIDLGKEKMNHKEKVV